MLKIISHSERETLKLGEKIVRFLVGGDIVCLFGNLGAGKTILVKGMAKGLGISQNEVISPSFVLIREYLPAGKQACPIKKTKTKIALYHLDLYRLRNPKDILKLGYEEYLYNQGICVIEWAQRMKGFLPREFLKIELKIKSNTKRVILLIAKGARYNKILRSLKIK